MDLALCVCVRAEKVSSDLIKELVGGSCDFFVVGDPDKKGKEITYEIEIFNDVVEILIFLVAA